MPLAHGPQDRKSLEPQKCFNKAPETLAGLEPADKARKYNDTEIRCVRTACSLPEVELRKILTISHKKLLSEGRTKRGNKIVLTKELLPDENSDNPGLIYVYPDLVSDIKNCRYGLGWDISYKKNHRGLYPFAVPYMSLVHSEREKGVSREAGKGKYQIHRGH